MLPALPLAALAAAAPLAALASERFLGFAPCELCLWQRWPYWAAAALALAALAVPARARPWLLGAAGIAVLVSGAIGGFHVGVEQGWWPSPLPGCATPQVTGGSVDDLFNRLAPMPNKPCDAATYPIPFLPVSMAAMNLLYALGLGTLALRWSSRGATA